MKSFLKKLFIFVIILALYFLPSLIWMGDNDYYRSLNLPTYAPAPIVFTIAWSILYIIFASFLTIKITNNNLIKEQMVGFIINYVISFFFNFTFFELKNLFLAFSITVLSCASAIYIFITLLKEKRRNALIITPYILWTLFASVLMGHIYLIN